MADRDRFPGCSLKVRDAGQAGLYWFLWPENAADLCKISIF